MKKIITILAFAIIAFISSDLKAQDISGPSPLTVGVAEYFFYTGGNTIAPDAFWYTSEDPTHRPFLNGNEMSIPVDPDDIGAGQLPGVIFNTPGVKSITAHYGGWSNHSAAAVILVTVVAAP